MKYPHTPTLEDEKFLRRFRSEMRFVQHPVVSKALRLAVPKLGTDFSGRTRDLIEQKDGSFKLGPEYVPNPHRPPAHEQFPTIGTSPAGPALMAIRETLAKPKRRRRRRKPKAVTA